LKQAPPEPTSFSVTPDADGDRTALRGALDIRTLRQAENELWTEPGSRTKRKSILDLSGLSALDTPGALLLCGLRERGAALIGVRPEHQALLDLIGGLDLKPLPKLESPPKWRQLAIKVGSGAEGAWHGAVDLITFVGRAWSIIVRALIHPRSLRLPAIARHISETGIHALPIVGLMAVMISIVVGYQSVAQLRPLGGEDFTVNLVAVSVLREMGVLITAIMVAGRSGSAFTAELGVMKMREEVDALAVMGIDSMQVLVVPRLIGLIISLPLLAFFADIMGLLGGAMISQTLLDISPLQYFERVRKAVDGWDLFVGLFKAPIFAFFIGVIGCMHGLRVTGSAESVGDETTRAVVKAIFMVIVLDALFSILFEQLGI
jgi:phospholipid/cholesterol/gamma-HCH transport system permease protein